MMLHIFLYFPHALINPILFFLKPYPSESFKLNQFQLPLSLFPVLPLFIFFVSCGKLQLLHKCNANVKLVIYRSNLELPVRPAIQRVESIQPQSPGVWMIPTFSQNTSILVIILEDTGYIGEEMVEGVANTFIFVQGQSAKRKSVIWIAAGFFSEILLELSRGILYQCSTEFRIYNTFTQLRQNSLFPNMNSVKSVLRCVFLRKNGHYAGLTI